MAPKWSCATLWSNLLRLMSSWSSFALLKSWDSRLLKTYIKLGLGYTKGTWPPLRNLFPLPHYALKSKFKSQGIYVWRPNLAQKLQWVLKNSYRNFEKLTFHPNLEIKWIQFFRCPWHIADFPLPSPKCQTQFKVYSWKVHIIC